MRKLSSIQFIKNIESIPNADKIELATIRDWKVVIQKGLHSIGDKIVYFEIDSFLPVIEAFDFLLKGTKVKKLLIDGEEKEGIRLRTIKLRGQISQGLIMPLTILDGLKYENDDRENPKYSDQEGKDVSELLGVYKYERPIPACIAGEVKGYFPAFIPKTDEERIQNLGDALSRIKGYEMFITSKLDGTSATYFRRDGVFGVCSRNLELKETEDNVFWVIAKKYKLDEILEDNMCIQGEIVGPGIQSNPLKLSEFELFVYNVFNINEQKYLSYVELCKYLALKKLKMVPVINDEFIIDHTVEQLLELANAKSPLNDKVDQEGIVIRPLIERTETVNRVMTRLSFKVISNNYLLKHE